MARELDVYSLNRIKDLDIDPETLGGRIGSFMSGVKGHAVLLVVRTHDTMHSFVLAGGAQSANAAQHVAEATGSQIVDGEPVFDTIDLDVRSVAVARFDRRGGVHRSTQVGVDLAATSKALAGLLEAGQWVAMTVREPRRGESKRWDTWLRHRMGTGNQPPQHHSVSNNAVITHIITGAASRGDAKRLAKTIPSILPGFDIPTTGTPLWRGGDMLALVGGVVALVGCVPVWGQPWKMLILAGVLLIAAGVAQGLRSWTHASVFNLLARPPAVGGRLAGKPRNEHRDSDGNLTRERQGGYPLNWLVHKVGPSLVAAFIAPQSGATHGVSSTGARRAPAAVQAHIGPYIGTSNGTPVCVSAKDAFGGMLVLGEANSGKTQFLHGVFGWHVLERLAPSTIEGAPGKRNALIAFESKRDGAAKYMQWSRTLGDQPLLIDVADATSFALDVFPTSGSLESQVREIVGALKYAFGEGDIQARSFETLTQVITGGLAVTSEVATAAGLPGDRSPLWYAYVLLGGLGEDPGVELAAAIRSIALQMEAAGHTESELLYARDKLAALYEVGTPTSRRSFLEAPRNKIAPLLALESWWEPRRPRVTWQQILENHGSVIINTGASIRDGSTIDDELNKILQSMLMYLLRSEINRTCAGWIEQGRSVSIFADELSLLAGSSPEVITWLRDQGRSYGVRLFFATQYAEQLPERLRATVLEFSTLIGLAQRQPGHGSNTGSRLQC